MGTLYYGDNLDILRRYVKDETADLVYLDPPFNSAQNYNAFFVEKDGTAAASQIRAFEDTWTWNQESQRVYEELILQDITDLRRGDHSGARLKIEQERSDREREKTEEEVLGIFEHWAKNPILRDCFRELGPEERTRRLREIFGREPKKTESQNGASEQPDQTKSN